MFGQTFAPHDLFVVGVLIILEGVLSIDNALVLGLLAKRLPKHLQPRALTFGLVGALVFRIIAIGTATFLLEWRIAKLIGGGYLVWVALKHFFIDAHPDEHMSVDNKGNTTLVANDDGHVLSDAEVQSHVHGSSAMAKLDLEHVTSTHTKTFWLTVAVIELTDIAFAIDSILAAIGLVEGRPKDHPTDAFHPKMWVIITGGMLGVVLMRFAAVLFIRLLEKFPRFETSAYLLVIVIGGKLVLDWLINSKEQPDRINFHDPGSVAFWAFWILMVFCFAVGFLPVKKVVASSSS